MKILIAILLSLFFVSKGNCQGIDFQQISSLSEVKKIALEKNKFIFLDLYATWCGPCKQMDKSVFSLSKVGDFFNKNFISIKVQMDKTKIDNDLIRFWYADAETISNQYKIPGYPTYLFFSPEGELVHRISGAMSTENFLREGATALNMNKIYSDLLQQYRKGELDILLYKQLARLTLKLNEDDLAQEIAGKYISQLKTDSLYTLDNLIFIAEFTRKTTDNGFKVLFNDSVKVNQVINDKVGRHFVQGVVNDIIYNEQVVIPFEKDNKMSYAGMKDKLQQYGSRGLGIYYEKVVPIILNNEELLPLLKKSEIPNWKDLEKKLIKKYGSTAKKSVWSAQAYSYFVSKNVKKFVQIKAQILKEFPKELSNTRLGDDAWFVFENALTSKELETALKWCHRIISEEPENAAIVDTYANLLFKLGNREEALKWAKKAVNLDPNRKEILENYNKIQMNIPTWPL